MLTINIWTWTTTLLETEGFRFQGPMERTSCMETHKYVGNIGMFGNTSIHLGTLLDVSGWLIICHLPPILYCDTQESQDVTYILKTLINDTCMSQGFFKKLTLWSLAAAYLFVEGTSWKATGFTACCMFFLGGVFIITLESFKMVVVEDIYIANAGVHGPNPDRFLAAVKYIVEYQPRMEPWKFERC